jgi:hypothetical protein
MAGRLVAGVHERASEGEGGAMMTDGPETDHRMAEALLPKGSWYVSSPRSDSVIVWSGVPWQPSSIIGDAWKALEALPLDENGSCPWYWKLTSTPTGYSMQVWRAGDERWNQPGHGPCATASAEAAPLAICRAILAALDQR